MQQFMVTLRRFSPKLGCHFYQDSVAASQTSVTLETGQGVDAYVMPRVGFIVGLVVFSDHARVADTLTIAPQINGVALSDSIDLDANHGEATVVEINKDLNSFFNAGDRISAEITTGASWEPTAANIIVNVLVELTMEDSPSTTLIATGGSGAYDKGYDSGHEIT